MKYSFRKMILPLLDATQPIFTYNHEQMRGAIIALICMLRASSGNCATLSIPHQIGSAGQTLIAAASFSPEGQDISGIQFDFESDAALSTRVLPGTTIGASGKVMHSGVLPNGALRVVIIGINAEPIPDGELVRAVINVDSTTPPRSAEIRITNCFATDPDGNPVSVKTSPIEVEIQTGTALLLFGTAGVVNSASLLPGPVSPGEILTVFGGTRLAESDMVLFNGTESPILYTGPGQINTVVPFTLNVAAAATMEIRTAGVSLGTVSLATAAATPAIFTQQSSGAGPGIILNEDYTSNSYSNPAPRGSTVIVYGTGFGVLDRIAEGATQPSMGVPVSATINGLSAEVTYIGPAGPIAGVVEIHLRIPAGIHPANTAPISIIISSTATQPGVTISIQ